MGALDDTSNDPATYVVDFCRAVEGYRQRATAEVGFNPDVFVASTKMFQSLPDAAIAGFESGLRRLIAVPTYVFLESFTYVQEHQTLKDRLSRERRSLLRLYEMTMALASLASDPLTSDQKNEAAHRFNTALIRLLEGHTPRLLACQSNEGAEDA